MRLTEGFNLLATAPDGIKRLRELILSLAVRGKLVPQDPSDEPASELLKKIRAEKERLIAEGKIKKDKPLPAIGDEEKPFELPESWAWARLPEVYASISPNGNKLMTSKMLEMGKFPVVDQGKSYIAGYTDNEALLIKLPEPVVIFGDHTTEVKYIDFDFVAGADGVKILWPLKQNAKFFYHQLRSFELESRGYARHFKVLNECFYALPPLAEQSRIVAKVEELMALCDALETRGQLEAEQHARLTATLFDALAASESAHQLQENWARLAASFDLVLDRPEAVDALEQTLLQLAVRGLLVPQDPSNEPASELLKQIRAEKDRLIAEGKIKKDKPLPAISDDEKPFELPQGWEWVALETIASVGTGTTPSRDNSAYFTLPEISWVTSGETGQPFIEKTEQYVSTTALKETSLTVYPAGTLIVAMYGQGKTRGQISELLIPAATNQACAAIVLPITDTCLRKYVKLYFEKIYDEIRLEAAGGAQPNLNVGKVKSTLISLPPLAEQSRIVARIEALRTLCGQLRQRLTASCQTQAHLAEALVAQV